MTGGAGFIGSHLVDRLLIEGHQVLVIDNLSTGRIANLEEHLGQRRLKFVRGDVRDYNLVKKWVRDQECVVHLAAITSVPFSVEHAEETSQVNVTGTENVLQASVDNGVQKMLFASSCAVYGEPAILPISEDEPLKPISPYAASKASACKLCYDVRKDRGLKTVCLQLFNVYGPRQGYNGDGGVISHFLSKLVQNEAPVIYGDGEQTRDFVFVEDVVDTLCRFIVANCTDASYNLGSGVATTINELLALIQRLTGVQTKRPVYNKPRLGDIRRSQADMRKLGNELRYRPETRLEDGLRQFLPVLHATTENRLDNENNGK